VALRETDMPVTDLLSIVGQLSHDSADSLMMRYQDVARLTTANPDAWIMSVRAEAGLPPARVTLVRRLVRSGRHSAIVNAWSDR
jgi:hypothetical protein